jgi:predicted alpha/beta-fold hydrolase
LPNSFRAPWWLGNRHLHTIYAALRGKLQRRLHYRRERWSTPDGDFVDVDFYPARVSSRSVGEPMLVLFHGLEGSSSSHYAAAFARATDALGWRFAVPHFRGCSGVPNHLPRAYHSGDSEEIAWLLGRFKTTIGSAPLYAVGVSLGGNALLKWLGEAGEGARDCVAAAAAVSAPLDLRLSGDALGSGFNKVYTRMFLASMKDKSEAKLRRHPDIFDGTAMRAARTLRQFDDVVTAPLHGFRDVDDYWTRASARPLLSCIVVPTLLLNALDDPFVPPEALPDTEQLPPCVDAEFPTRGGHVGFVTGTFPGRLDWVPRRVLRYFLMHGGGVQSVQASQTTKAAKAADTAPATGK